MSIETDPITLDEINTAIRSILLTGMSYGIGGRAMTRADLKDLMALKRHVIKNSLRATADGAGMITEIRGGSSEDSEWGD